MSRRSYLPVGVKALQRWHRITSLMAGSSVVMLLGLYTGTVYTQQQWNEHYTLWRELERHEKQYELSQESIANALRETASRSNMVPLGPERLLRIPMAPTTPAIQPTPLPTPGSPFFPVGY
ncbi:MAG: hypothetical protein Q6J68_07415 [Thermostichales cyanobacterium SZTDM-1c_bins_54]